MIKKFLSLLLAVLLVAGPTIGQTVNDGREAANKGDFARALRIWMPLADKGDSEAQYNLGRMYARGDGVERNFHEAFFWFEKAAKNGHRAASEKLSHMYEVGDGVGRDMERARFWRDAAQKKIEKLPTHPVELQPLGNEIKEEAVVETPKSTPVVEVAQRPLPQDPPVSLPKGTIQEGTLCNKKLYSDTLPAVEGKALGALKCATTDSVRPYVVKNPSGPIGSKEWEEKWVVRGCGSTHEVNVKFAEDGVGGAYYILR